MHYLGIPLEPNINWSGVQIIVTSSRELKAQNNTLFTNLDMKMHWTKAPKISRTKQTTRFTCTAQGVCHVNFYGANLPMHESLLCDEDDDFTWCANIKNNHIKHTQATQKNIVTICILLMVVYYHVSRIVTVAHPTEQKLEYRAVRCDN